MSNVPRVAEEALKLSPTERAELIDLLFESFDPSQPARPSEIEQAWAAEAESRIDAFDKGELRAIPAEDVFRRLEK